MLCHFFNVLFSKHLCLFIFFPVKPPLVAKQLPPYGQLLPSTLLSLLERPLELMLVMHHFNSMCHLLHSAAFSKEAHNVMSHRRQGSGDIVSFGIMSQSPTRR